VDLGFVIFNALIAICVCCCACCLGPAPSMSQANQAQTDVDTVQELEKSTKILENLQENTPLMADPENPATQGQSSDPTTTNALNNLTGAQSSTGTSTINDSSSKRNEVLFVVGYIILLGILQFYIDVNCKAGVGTWGVASFWMLILGAVLTMAIDSSTFTVLIMAMTNTIGRSSPKASDLVTIIAVAALYWTIYVWGIVALFNSSGIVACHGLYLMDLGFVSFFSVLILLCLCMCFLRCILKFKRHFERV